MKFINKESNQNKKMRGGRGGFANRGRRDNIAMSRTTFVNKDQTNSARRLQRDLKELLESTTPMVGVIAKPLPNDMYTWHGNLKGPAGTKWENGVFHFEMTIPQDYPCSPPGITLYSTIPHPNVFGTKLCLDMLDNTKHTLYDNGWVAAYTIEAVLIQLQSFLFEELPGDIETKTGILIQTAVKNANDFKCFVCKHRGPLSADPAFPKAAIADDFVMVKTPKELLHDELVCFQTKMPLREGTLGIGISLKKSPRTGQFMYINPTMDLMNMRSFTKLKIRRALQGERFTHWLPLYFGENEVFTIESENYDHETQSMVQTKKTVDTLQRFETHIESSLNFICNGDSSKPYNHEQAQKVMLKLIGTHIIDMMKENRHISIVAIRRVFNFIRLFLNIMKKDAKV